MNIERDPCLTASLKEANFRRRSWDPPASDLDEVPYRTVLCTRHLHEERNFARASRQAPTLTVADAVENVDGSHRWGEGKMKNTTFKVRGGNVGSTCKGTKKMIANRGG